MPSPLSCFKAYDIRGRVPDPLSPALAYALGCALAEEPGVRQIVVGYDVRLSGPILFNALVAGIRAKGVAVTSLGLVGTEEVYFAAAHKDYDIGVMITGSHNPADENGVKLVRRGAVPISSDSGLTAIKDRVAKHLASDALQENVEPAHVATCDIAEEYCSWLLTTSGFSEQSRARPFTVLASVGNGAAGPLLAKLTPNLPFSVHLHHPEPDGHFPNGVPNPLLPERRADTSAAVRAAHADLGVAWDGDFDRCFFFDANGTFIEGYYLVGLIAQAILEKHPGESIIHDPRLYWNTVEIVEACGGRPIVSKTGHAFIKERMRKENAIYGGEMSAHHYFREFAFCDCGMLPFLFVTKLLLDSGTTLEERIADRMQRYPCSGEINRRVAHPKDVVAAVSARYAKEASACSTLDGIDLVYPTWRCNLRCSNTEPLLRLNVESRGDRALMEEKTQELLRLIDSFEQEAG